MARLLTSYQCYDADIFEMDFTHRTSLIIVDRAYQKGFGSYWLSESLFDAFCNSQLPNTVGQLKQVIPFFKKYVILGKGIVCVVKRQ